MSTQTETQPSNEPAPSLVNTPPANPETTPPTTTPEPAPPANPEEPKAPEAPKEPEAPVVLSADDITLPEGFTLDEPMRDEFLGIMNNNELDAKGRSDALVGLYSKALTAASEANSNAWATMQTEWQEAVKTDPEIGGAKFEASLTKVGKLVEEFGSNELREVFDMTGAGNNVHVVKFLAKLADNLTEGGFTAGNPTTAPADAASKMFPSMKG